jgi:hypothetical protein
LITFSMYSTSWKILKSAKMSAFSRGHVGQLTICSSGELDFRSRSKLNMIILLCSQCIRDDCSKAIQNPVMDCRNSKCLKDGRKCCTCPITQKLDEMGSMSRLGHALLFVFRWPINTKQKRCPEPTRGV